MFELYPWQQDYWKYLNKKIPKYSHSYLLYGDLGIGKRKLAEYWIAYLLCCHKKQSCACMQCKSCRLLQYKNHPDFFLLEPDKFKNIICINNIIELLEFTKTKNFISNYKIVLIDHSEYMNIHASNALLKTLEEPINNTVIFFLITNKKNMLLSTINSRCLKQKCPIPSFTHSILWLASNFPNEKYELLKFLLILSHGSPLYAKELYITGMHKNYALIMNGLKNLINKIVSPSDVYVRWRNIPLLFLIDYFFSFIQYIVRSKLEYNSILENPIAKFIFNKSLISDLLLIQKWLILERQKLLNNSNLNKQLIIESFLIQLITIIK